jgi:hypothetical protein
MNEFVIRLGRRERFYLESMGLAGLEGWRIVRHKLNWGVLYTRIKQTYVAAFKHPVTLAIIVDLIPESQAD